MRHDPSRRDEEPRAFWRSRYAIGLVVLGAIAWGSPHISPTLLYLIATWGIITGILEIVSTVRLPKPSTSQWCLALSGVSSVLIGMLLLGLPAAGQASVVRLLGLYAFVFGALILVAAFHLRAGGGVVPSVVSRLAGGVGRP